MPKFEYEGRAELELEEGGFVPSSIYLPDLRHPVTGVVTLDRVLYESFFPDKSREEREKWERGEALTSATVCGDLGRVKITVESIDDQA